MASILCTPAGPDSYVPAGYSRVTPDSSMVHLWSTEGTSATNASGTRGDLSAVAFGSAVARAGAERVMNDVFAAVAATDGAELGDADLVALVTDHRTGEWWALTGSGHHRLFVHAGEGGPICGSHLAEVAAGAGDRLQVDRRYEDMLLGFGFYPFGATSFEHINSTHPGTLEHFAAGQTSPGASRGVSAVGTTIDVGNRDAADSLLLMLEDAVARQAGDTDDQAVLMGGFDSALVASLLRRRGHNVTTFTFDFGSPVYNQANVELATSFLGCEHHWVPITPDKLGSALLSLPHLLNQPSAQPHYQLHTVLAAQAVSSAGFSHVFTGDGCDAAFLGFPTVSKRANLQRLTQKVPAPLLRGGLAGLSPAVVDRWGGHVARTARSTLRSQLLPWPANAHLATQYLDDVTLARLRLGEAPSQEMSVADVRIELAKGLEDSEAIRIAFAGNAATAASRIKVDGAIITTGVAQSSPFTDSLVKGFAAALPVESLRPSGSAAGGLGKALLSEMAMRHELLPATIINQPKQSPSTSPVDMWYAGPLRDTVVELCDHLPFDCDRDELNRLLSPNRVDDLYRQKVTLSQHVMQAVGLLSSYGSFTRLAE